MVGHSTLVSLGIICGESVDLQKLGSFFVTKIMIYLRSTLKYQSKTRKLSVIYILTLQNHTYTFGKGSKISPCALE